MTTQPLNLFDVINYYDENIGLFVKSFGCIDYNECIKEMDECFEMCIRDRFWGIKEQNIKFKVTDFWLVHKWWDC